MRRVICFGEALIDFLNTGKRVEGQIVLNEFTQFPGGAPANAAVAVAKLGGESFFLGQVGSDHFGDFLLDSMKAYGVDTGYALQHSSAATALAYVFLDENGERSFEFRRDGTADLMFTEQDATENVFSNDCVFHFCSNTLTDAAIAIVTNALVKRAKQNNGFISFDVNLRSALWPQGTIERSRVNNLVHRSDLVKFAVEELAYLNEGKLEPYLDQCFAEGVKVILVTDGPNPITIYTNQGKKSVMPPSVCAVDTTGGGDAFIGAVLYKLSKIASPSLAVDDLNWVSEIVEFASFCGASAVSKQGAFPAFPTHQDIQLLKEK